MVLSPSARRARWLVPLALLAAIALTALIPTLSAADTPDLAPVTPQQLIEKVQQANVDAFSGTIELTTNLGIPNLGAIRNNTASESEFSPLDLLSGVHAADVRVDGPQRQSVTMRGDLSETSVYHDGTDVWTWQSVGSKVSHTTIPDHASDGRDEAPAPPGTPPGTMPTPGDLAKQFLDAVTPTTVVTVATPAYVADRPVYELVLAPRDPASTIDHVGIAVDAANGMPLQVTVAAKDQTKPAVRLGFTKVDYNRPSGSFSFTPPPGANVNGALDPPEAQHRGREGNGYGYAPGQPASIGAPTTTTVVGQSWTQVVVVSNAQLPIGTGPLLRAATPVTGAFGSGNLLATNLVSVLVLPDGRVAAGFVTPAALEAAVQP